jgi:hypothetical protein
MRLETKLTHISKQLDVATFALNELRKMKLPPDAVIVVAEAIIAMRRIEEKVDTCTKQKGLREGRVAATPPV